MRHEKKQGLTSLEHRVLDKEQIIYTIDFENEKCDVSSLTSNKAILALTQARTSAVAAKILVEGFFREQIRMNFEDGSVDVAAIVELHAEAIVEREVRALLVDGWGDKKALRTVEGEVSRKVRELVSGEIARKFDVHVSVEIVPKGAKS